MKKQENTQDLKNAQEIYEKVKAEMKFEAEQRKLKDKKKQKITLQMKNIAKAETQVKIAQKRLENELKKLEKISNQGEEKLEKTSQNQEIEEES